MKKSPGKRKHLERNSFILIHMCVCVCVCVLILMNALRGYFILSAIEKSEADSGETVSGFQVRWRVLRMSA